ncbi:MAG: hypothetical protein NVV59_13220 [Chitinophagaceae bacterium]|nr:hypothetical protein [Chitinophagaceae bacterium]
MKTIITALALICFANAADAQVPTQKNNDLFFDIQTRAPFAARYDSTTGTLYNTSTGKPVDFFLNNTGDTVSSRGFYIVNNYLLWDNNSYRLDNGRSAWREEKLWDSKTNTELKRDNLWEKYQKPGMRRDGL